MIRRSLAAVGLAVAAGTAGWFGYSTSHATAAGPAVCALARINPAWAGTEPSGDGGMVAGHVWICDDGTWTGPFTTQR